MRTDSEKWSKTPIPGPLFVFVDGQLHKNNPCNSKALLRLQERRAEPDRHQEAAGPPEVGSSEERDQRQSQDAQGGAPASGTVVQLVLLICPMCNPGKTNNLSGSQSYLNAHSLFSKSKVRTSARL